MDLPRISVVTPSFNQGRFIEATLRSIHDPGYPHLEHIVIDGGSSDETVDILHRYDGRITYWVSEPDRGQTDALIKGFGRATGEIWCWLNSDDLFEPWTLFEVADYFRRHPQREFIYGDATWIDTEGTVIKPKREHRWSRFVWLYDHNFIPQPSTFWRAGLYRAAGGIDPEFSLAMDADLWIRFAERTRPWHVARPWSRMRFYPEQRNTALRGASNLEGRRIRARYVPPMRAWDLAARKTLARATRVGLKLAAGGYPLGELSRHTGGLLGRGGWESREARRQRGAGSPPGQGLPPSPAADPGSDPSPH